MSANLITLTRPQYDALMTDSAALAAERERGAKLAEALRAVAADGCRVTGQPDDFLCARYKDEPDQWCGGCIAAIALAAYESEA